MYALRNRGSIYHILNPKTGLTAYGHRVSQIRRKFTGRIVSALDAYSTSGKDLVQTLYSERAQKSVGDEFEIIFVLPLSSLSAASQSQLMRAAPSRNWFKRVVP